LRFALHLSHAFLPLPFFPPQTKQPPDAIGWIALAVGAAWLVSAVILLFSPVMLKLPGTKGTRALERLMGLLLILVAVQRFLDGVSDYQGASPP